MPVEGVVIPPGIVCLTRESAEILARGESRKSECRCEELRKDGKWMANVRKNATFFANKKKF